MCWASNARGQQSAAVVAAMPTGRSVMLTLAVLWLPLITAAGAAAGDVHHQPSFISHPQTIRAKQGETVVLPCEISHKGPFVVVWKRQRRVISAQDSIVVRDPRFSLVDGYSLRISAVKPGDQSSYICSLDTEPLSELSHRLEVLFGPVVSAQPSSGVLVVKLGETARLTCQASGNPPPRIAWRKQAGTLPSGESRHEDRLYTVSGVTRQMAGVYQCVAENGVGEPSTASVHLQVQYPPEVEVERSVVYTGEGFGAELACVVFAEPEAEVRWSRDSAALDPSRHHSSTGERQDSTRHLLSIDSVTLADFGTYSCHASNSMGTASGRIQISGTPERVQVTSSPIGAAPASYQLSWLVRSSSPVLEYKVAYRQSKMNSTAVVSSGGWREVLVPRTGGDVVDDTWHRQSIPLTGLTPAATYDLHVQARNRHGWNAVSDMFHFSTLARGEALESRRFNIASHQSSHFVAVLLCEGAAFLIPAALLGAGWL